MLTSARLRPSNASSVGCGGGSCPSLLRGKDRAPVTASNQTDLAYAAFHCSSLRALAASISVEETKREPTAPLDSDGMSSIEKRCAGLVNCIYAARGLYSVYILTALHRHFIRYSEHRIRNVREIESRVNISPSLHMCHFTQKAMVSQRCNPR